jgi:integration host factor subunit alpha
MKLTKAHIVQRVADLGFTNKKSALMVDSLLDVIKATLEGGEDVLISGLGKFCIKEKKKRRGRNPQTGQDLFLNERRVVTFKCSSVLRNKMNGRSSFGM